MKAGVRLQRHIGLGHPTMCYTDASDGNRFGTIKPSISRRDCSKIRPAMRVVTCTEPAYLQRAKQTKFSEIPSLKSIKIFKEWQES
jgi:hypothetical protein